jgi:hypothetical protein
MMNRYLEALTSDAVYLKIATFIMIVLSNTYKIINRQRLSNNRYLKTWKTVHIYIRKQMCKNNSNSLYHVWKCFQLNTIKSKICLKARKEEIPKIKK